MRVSTKDGDVGQLAYAEAIRAGKNIRIFVNGSEVKDAITADDEQGIVDYIPRDENGDIKVAPNGEEVVVERLTGEVLVVLEDL